MLVPIAARAADLTSDSFRLLVESVQDYAIFMLDTEGRVLTWNRGAERIKGYSADEIIGRHFSAFYPQVDIDAHKPENELRIALREGRVEDEGWRVRKDGSRFWANVVITALFDDTGRLQGFGKVTRDLTERQAAAELARELAAEQAARAAAEEAEGRLRTERERYKALSRRLEVILEGVADGISVQDRSGAVIYANSAAARISGFDRVEDFLGALPEELLAFYELFDEGGNSFPAANLPGRRVLNGEPEASAVLRVRDLRSDRDWWTFIRATPVLDDQGQAELAVNVWHDVSVDRRREEHERTITRATAALSSSLEPEVALRALAGVFVPGLADWTVIHLLDGVDLRSVALAHTDAGPPEQASRLAELSIATRDVTHGIWKVLQTGKPELYADLQQELSGMPAGAAPTLRELSESGIRSLLIVPICVRDRVSGTIALAWVESRRRYDRMDLVLASELGRRAGTTIENARLYAAEKKARARSEAAAQAAAEAARAAEEASRVKDEFLATVSHELRTPLNAIMGWSSLLKERSTDPSLAKGLDVIHRNAHAQGKIIEDILDVSRIITGKMRLDLKPADLGGVVRDAIEVVRPSAAAKRITIAFAPPPEPCLLVADPDRLQQVIWNLLSNAVKFTEPGGSVAIVIEREGSELRVTVVDTGRGIEPDFLPYVFDRFKQGDGSTTRQVGGLGLGLAIVRHIVELHGGHVAARSQGPGRGSTFSISLPVRATVPALHEPDQALAKGAQEGEPQGSSKLGGLRVLVIDDVADARDLLQLLLEGFGGQVRTAGSAREALEVLRDFRPDVLVSDVGMPDEDGYSLMRRVRALETAQGGGVPAIALTAYATREDRARALAAGFTTHIGKPVKPDDLLAAVLSVAQLER